MNKFSLKIQIVFTYLTILAAVFNCLLGLGFMTDFYTLFMNGNDEMYNFFKELQTVNTALFSFGLTFLVMSLFLLTFDINKKTAGIFGVSYTLIAAIINIIRGASVLSSNLAFRTRYEKLDYSAIEGYAPSTAPFEMISALLIISMMIIVLLFSLTLINYLLDRKEGLNEKS
ncbi:hypothetical protein [Spirochaeta isovalerica]|uniref:Uncharacterized membrane protein YidH (DUF202 family) n=1 Tax=Spirochaeta isovalerica TaxID=150 RepID=A0A841RBV0_9SPIO|nr:hypothetical protein [Spirochaeta isovalerica]MBB6479882.1 uncharacterized membrane protein YidH (DUF202 family) [Spirochaeta isovalerica]